jgi:dienelactone hydrolase
MRSLRTAVAVIALALVTVGGVDAGAGSDDGSRPAFTTTAATTVLDVQIPVPGQQPQPAYLVLPRHTAAHRAPAVLFLHWFEPPAKDSSRDEYLAEATRLAERGVVSLLPQQRFPWAFDPMGDARDRAAIIAQLDAAQRALDVLRQRPEVNQSRVAIVGHDYGAMYGLDLAARNPSVAAVVSMAADATWSNWFNMFWIGYEGQQAADYAALFADLDPVAVAGSAPALYLQWSSNDFFIPAAVRDQFSAAAPSAKVSVYDHVGHELGIAAQTDRDAWLLDQLR